MKGKKPKIFGVVMALVLALSLAVAAVPAVTVSADPGAGKWTAVPTPQDREVGDYTLWNVSDVGPIAVSPDGGTVFAAVKGNSTNASGPASWHLMRSTDGGYSWKLMWTSTQAIVDIDVSDDWVDDDTVVVATANATAGAAYISTDKGQTVASWGTFADPVTSLDIGLDEDGNLVAVVGTDGAPGDVYLRTLTLTWATQSVGYDVLDVGIPTYATDEGIIAVVTDGTDTWARTKLSTNVWGANIADTTFVDQNGGSIAATRASLGFPDDYTTTVVAYGGNNVFFVGLTGGNEGDVFEVTSMPVGASPLAEDLDVRGVVGVNPTETEIHSIAVSGNLAEATIIAGTADFVTGIAAQTLVYYSTDAGATWSGTMKSPTGGTSGANTYVAMGSPIAYAGTSGAESAFSASTTDPVGMAWNQRGLIDTVITTITDIAASETYATDKQLFMATQKSAYGTFSLWLTSNEGATWDRILCNSPSAAVLFNRVQLVPGYVFVALVNPPAGLSGACMVLRSHDGGITFIGLLLPKADITAWKVTGVTTVYTGHAGGAIWWTTDFATWDKPEETEITGTVTDIELGSDILVGDDAGKVYLSTDDGLTVERVGTNVVGSGTTHVAFDVGYEVNKILYAGASATDVYRFDVDTSTVWEAISATTIAVSGLISADDGTLYASDATADAGVARSVNPTRAIALTGPTFEAMTNGLPTGATLEGLEVVPGSNILFAIDTACVGLVIFTDTLTGKVTPLLPPDGETSGYIMEAGYYYGYARVMLAWEVMTGALEYEVEVALDEDFGTIYTTTTPEGTVVEVYLPLGTIFYWRVRVMDPLYSQWSETWSFTTPLGPGAARPELQSPAAGQQGVALRPVLEWSSVIGATHYELMVAEDCDWNNLEVNAVGTAALEGVTVYALITDLEEGTDYCWKVCGVTLEDGTEITRSDWSDIGTFTTMTEPVPEAAPGTPVWVWVVIAIGAVLAVAVLVLIMRTRKPV